MFKKGLFFSSITALIVGLSLLPLALGLGLSGQKISPIVYEPGKSIVNHYVITDTDREVDISVVGSFAEYITLSEVINNEFDLKISFPDNLSLPGSYLFSLTAKEKPEENAGGISSLLSIEKLFQVKVYSKEKDLAVSLSSPSVNVGSPVNFQINLESQCYQDIDLVKGKIVVYDSNNKAVGEVTTPTVSLPQLTSKTLSANFPTTSLLPGNYWAKAIVYFDGKSKEANSTFRIGNMDLVLKGYTLEMERGFSQFEVQVFNNWGNELRNVYAKLFLNNEELLQTPSIDLAPWEEGKLSGLLKVELEPGEYSGKLQLFFEGESKEEPVKIKIIRSKEELVLEQEKTQRQVLILVGISAGIIALILAFLLYFKTRKRNKNEDF